MGRTVSELLDSIDAAELNDWIAYYSHDPWDIRQDFAAAQVCSTIARVHGVGIGPDGFMPQYGPRPEPEPMSDEDLKHQALIFAATFKGKINQQRR
jgi:hypothetical protein